MDRLTELQEAREAAVRVLDQVAQALEILDKAKFWGNWDMFGGDTFVSWIKRDRIKTANQEIARISDLVKELSQELADIDMVLPRGVSDTLSDNIWDVWADNFFTDFRVQGEIKEAIKQLEDFRLVIEDLIVQIDAEIDHLEDELDDEPDLRKSWLDDF